MDPDQNSQSLLHSFPQIYNADGIGKVIIKIDTGMSRYGCQPSELPQLIQVSVLTFTTLKQIKQFENKTQLYASGTDRIQHPVHLDTKQCRHANTKDGANYKSTSGKPRGQSIHYS